MATQALMNNIDTQAHRDEGKVSQLLQTLVALELGYDRLYRRGSEMDEKVLHAKAAAYQAAGFPSAINREGDPAAGASSTSWRELQEWVQRLEIDLESAPRERKAGGLRTAYSS